MYIFVLLILASTPFVNFSIKIGPSYINVTDLLIILGSHYWICCFLLQRNKKLVGGKFLIPFCIFIFTFILSFAVTNYPERVLTYTFAFLFKFVLFFFIANNIKTQKEIRVILYFWIFLTFVISLPGINTSLSHNRGLIDYIEAPTYGIFRNKTQYAYNLLSPALIGTSLVLLFPMRMWGKICLSAINLFLIIGIILSLSRGMWIGFLSGIFFIFFYSKKKIHLYLKLGLATLIILLIIFYAPEDYLIVNNLRNRVCSLETVFSNPRGSAMERGYAYSASWKMFRERPLLGFGAGTFDLEMFPYMPAEGQSLKFGHRGTIGGIGMEAHNSYITVLNGVGIIGLSALLWILIRAWKYIVQSVYYSRELKDGNAIIIGLGASFLALFIANFFFGALGSMELWFLLALIVVYKKLYCQTI